MSASTDFVPGREADLVDFLENFSTRAAAEAVAIGLTVLQCTAFQTLVDDFVASWEVTRSRSTRSGSAVIVKNEKKVLVVKNLRVLAGIVQKHPGTTNEQRDLLGLTVPAVRQHRPPPTTIPVVEKKGLDGNTVSLLIHGADSTRRAKPADCESALVYSFIGAAAPTNERDWFCEGSTTRNRFDVSFSPALPMGTKVWICAAWANATNQVGAASEPFSVVLTGTAVLPTAAKTGSNLSIAA